MTYEISSKPNESADNVDLYKTKCNALSAELDDAIKEANRLRKQNRKYRTDRLEAYRQGMSGDEWKTMKLVCFLCFEGGMILSLVIVTVVLVLGSV